MIFLVGPFPPPVHGASVITARVSDSLVAGASIVICSTSPQPGARGLAYHVSRLRRYGRCCLTILSRSPRSKTPAAVYLSLSGGWGLVYDLLVVIASRLTRSDLVFHHHSFAYLAKPSLIVRAIVRLAGPRQVHIALCPAMASRLRETYGRSLRTEVISNLAFLDPLDAASSPKQDLRTIGFLSNISFDKGIDRFLDLLADLRTRGSAIKGRIAGPFLDDKVRQYVEARMRTIGGVDYVGPLYGEEKTSFLRSIDLMVFPTRYINEAQPLVVYEAQAAGILVAASDRGCIAQMLGPASRLLLDPSASQLAPVAEQLVAWENDRTAFRTALSEAQRNLSIMREQQQTDRTYFRSLLLPYSGP